jgi:hypothetical protein
MAITHAIVYGGRDRYPPYAARENPVLLVDARGKTPAEVLVAAGLAVPPIGWHKAIPISEISESVKAQIERGPFTPTGAIPVMEVA